MVRFLFLIVACLAALTLPLEAASLTVTSGGGLNAWHVVGLMLGLGVLGAALDTTAMTLIEFMKMLDPNDQVARIINLLSQTNEMLREMPFMEGNLPTGHQTSILTGLPDVFWRLLNQGVLPSKERYAQITETTGMLEAYSQVDVKLANRGGQAGRVRLQKAKAFLEAMNQEVQSTLIYGAASAPEEFIGLSPRYSTTSAGNGDNIIKAGGTGSTDNTSIWLIQWGEDTISGIYPQGSKAGLDHEDLGIETVENAGGVTGALMRAYRDHWMWDCGLAVMDWRHAVRIANIDVSNLSSVSDAADLIFLMADAEERLPNNTGRRAFYMNRTVKRFLRHQTHTGVSTGGGLTFENIGGESIAMFGTTPVRTVDAILNTEDVVP